MSAPNTECANIQESLSAYLDKEEVDTVLVQKHLSECEHCTQMLKQLSDTKGLLTGLAPSVSTKDFTQDLEKHLQNNVYSRPFPRTAVAAIFIALAGALGILLYSGQNTQNEQTQKTAVAPDIKPLPEKKIEQQTNKIAVQPDLKVAQKPLKKEMNKVQPKLENNRMELKVKIATSNIEKTEVQTPSSYKPVNIALNTNELSAEDGLFDGMGFGSDEDGLYAIKL